MLIRLRVEWGAVNDLSAVCDEIEPNRPKLDLITMNGARIQAQRMTIDGV